MMDAALCNIIITRGGMTIFPIALSTQHSALSTQHSALSTQPGLPGVVTIPFSSSTIPCP